VLKCGVGALRCQLVPENAKKDCKLLKEHATHFHVFEDRMGHPQDAGDSGLAGQVFLSRFEWICWI
jgi:hypothetical protein